MFHGGKYFAEIFQRNGFAAWCNIPSEIFHAHAGGVVASDLINKLLINIVISNYYNYYISVEAHAYHRPAGSDELHYYASVINV